jgi:hypothetical protein
MTRTNAKEMLINALNADFLPGFAEFLDIPLPEFDPSDMDVDAAIQWEGKLSRHLCSIFGSFAGLFPLEIPLRIGQKNATMQGMLLAALQATRTVGAYYTGELEAQAEELKTQIESVKPVDDNVAISEEFWQQIYAGAGTLLAAFKASPEAAEAWGDAIQIAQVITETMNGMTDDLGNIKASTWMSLTSLSRLLLSNIQGAL